MMGWWSSAWRRKLFWPKTGERQEKKIRNVEGVEAESTNYKLILKKLVNLKKKYNL